MYKYLDKQEKQVMKDINNLAENAKAQYKQNFSSNVSKKYLYGQTYIYPTEQANKITQSVLHNLDELNVVFLKNISRHYYEKAIEEAEEYLGENIGKKYDPKVFEKIIMTFIIGNGLNYVYDSEIKRRVEYFASQLTNALNIQASSALLNTPMKLVNQNGLTLVRQSLATNSLGLAKVMNIQKRSLMIFVDSVAVYVANKSRLEAFEDAGIDSFIRLGVKDNRMCEFCRDHYGRILTLEEAKQEEIPSHNYCRCWLEPYKEEKSK